MYRMSVTWSLSVNSLKVKSMSTFTQESSGKAPAGDPSHESAYLVLLNNAGSCLCTCTLSGIDSGLLVATLSGGGNIS